MIFAFVKYRDDRIAVLDCLDASFFATICFVKWIGMMLNPQKTLMLINRIVTNWQVWAQDREVKFLHKYAEQGEKITIMYTATIYSTLILYMTQPIIPKIVDVLLKNGTELGKFPYPVDYYWFDGQTFYCYIMIHFYICGCVAAMSFVASDSMLIIYVHHVCSIFAALGYSNLIEGVYTWNFFVFIGLGMLLLNILGLQVLMGKNDPESTARFIAFIFAAEVVFYINCHISQILLDHSINVRFHVYNSQWYRLLPRDQILVQLMTLRCSVPCQLTAGKMLIMSLTNFGLANRTAMSYFAVIRSMQRL